MSAALNREPQRAINAAREGALAYLDAMEDAREKGRFVVAIHRTPNGYYARAVDFPGCIAKGASEVEALENVRGALRTFLAVARLVRDSAPRVELEISA